MANARVNYLTYKGRAVYPWLTAPDTQFIAEGQYKTGLRVPSDQASEIIAAAQALANETLGPSKAKNCRMPWKQEDETGEVVFTAKSKYAPKFFDANGMMIPATALPRLYGGSVLRLKGTMTSYDKGANYGILMNLNAVQVIEPVESIEDGDGGGFEAAEGGGYTHVATDDEGHDDGSSSKEDFNADF